MSGATAPRAASGPGTLLLSRADVAALASLEDCIAAVERAFRAQAAGDALTAAVLSVPAGDGVFHVKAAGLAGTTGRFAAKVNGNFPSNPERHRRPTIQGLIVLCETATGYPLAVLDSTEITALRTAAASGVAARHLATADARTLALIGCGRQGRMHLRAMRHVRPALRRVLAVDPDAGRAAALVADARDAGLDGEVRAEPASAARAADIVVTCTPSRAPLLRPGDLRPGAFLAAVGADNPDKQEVAAGLVAASRVIVDVLAQCAAMGDLHHALRAGLMTLDGVAAELAHVVGGTRPGRTSRDDVVIFDSTGTALEDVAVAALAHERALATGRGTRLDLLA